jgi:hypothetical protein
LRPPFDSLAILRAQDDFQAVSTNSDLARQNDRTKEADGRTLHRVQAYRRFAQVADRISVLAFSDFGGKDPRRPQRVQVRARHFLSETNVSMMLESGPKSHEPQSKNKKNDPRNLSK